MNKKVSIITPYYNTDIIQIRKLCDLFAKQNKNYYEWIIIDDCSKKNNLEQLKRYLMMYDFDYKIISNDSNLGAGKSRNVGISLAKGDYIVFVDSDDYVSSDFVETIMEMIDDSQEAEIILYDYARVKDDKEKKCVTVQKGRAGFLDRDFVIENITSNICGKVIKRKLIEANKISFIPISRFEDWDFITCCLARAEKIYYKKRILYYYVDNVNSSVYRNKNAVDCSLKAFNHIKEFCDLKEELLQSLFIREVLYVAIKQYGRYKTMDVFKKEMKSICDYIPKCSIKLSDYNFALHQKIILYLYKHKMFIVLRLLLKII